MNKRLYCILTLLFFCLTACKEESQEACVSQITPIAQGADRSFMMGFTTWSYGPNIADVDDTYDFVFRNGDIYSEHIDDKIPWSAWMNGTELPLEFVNEIKRRKESKSPNIPLSASISLFNNARKELKEDFDGLPPVYDSINQPNIIDAYWKHVDYVATELDPDYFIFTMEANDFYINQPAKWNGYIGLADAIKDSLDLYYPNLKISISITLHNLINPDVADVGQYYLDIANHINQFDFAAISFYPFFKNLHNQTEFQAAFDLLHSKINVPIAFVETSHLSEDLIIPNLNTNIESDLCEQKEYLQTLLLNAQSNDYEFIIWWAHRDFDALWETFPDEVKDLGQVWRDTGLLDEDGNKRPAWQCWAKAFAM